MRLPQPALRIYELIFELSLIRRLIPFVPAEAGTQNLETFVCIAR
jgi:hypothetical protein